MGVTTLLGIADLLDRFSGGGPQPITSDDLVPVLMDIKAGFGVVNSALDAADRNANLAVTSATAAATQVEDMGQDVNDIVSHTYRVVIPHSMSWLVGYITTHLIDPIRHTLAQHEHQIKFLLGWRGQIDTWRHTWVDPQLRQWHGFHVWFNTWPLKTLNQFHQWLTHPTEFGSWLAPYVVRPLVSWLMSPEHKIERDALNVALVDSWADNPDLVWEAVLRWLDSDT